MTNARYTVLSPWAESAIGKHTGLSPRLERLEGKRIGLFAHFKEGSPYLLKETARQLEAICHGISFLPFVYPVDTTEIHRDTTYFAPFQAWLDQVDGVISAFGDGGSCAMYLAYNLALIEKMGKPVVMLNSYKFEASARRGASARGVPMLRTVVLRKDGIVPPDTQDLDAWGRQYYEQEVAGVLQQIVDGLTAPLSPEELSPPLPENQAGLSFTGSLSEINEYFYCKGWTTGLPIVPPTAEAVEEMLEGTELPRDYVVAELPPRLGKATVEKIAVNAVMAGCLPTYMPILIAAVRCMADPKIHLEGWTCSYSTWAPLIVVSGPIRKSIFMNTGRNLLSPYRKPESTIPLALGYILMNISGMRPGIEDMSGPGHENKFGVCIAENEEDSPWPPLHADYGLDPADSAVTLFWPAEHLQLRASPNKLVFRQLCSKQPSGGFDPGAAYIIPPDTAKALAAEGWTKERIMNFVVEYNRRPEQDVPRVVFGNNHPPASVELPIQNEGYSTRTFWSRDHMFILVGGDDFITAYFGGGDHGGPATAKAELPKNWDELSLRYSHMRPDYLLY